jgi:predicted nucleic acid-binding Zn ribbon protein
MPEQLPDHTHCAICDAAVPADQKFCSEACEDEFNRTANRTKRRNNIFYVVVVILAIAIGAISLLI